jgi:hypothetical protein
MLHPTAPTPIFIRRAAPVAHASRDAVAVARSVRLITGLEEYRYIGTGTEATGNILPTCG